MSFQTVVDKMYLSSSFWNPRSFRFFKATLLDATLSYIVHLVADNVEELKLEPTMSSPFG
jgi:hypothetical protein